MRHRVVRLTAIASIVAGASAVVARRGYLRWGATTQEALEELPGDDITPLAGLVATRAITVHTAAKRVWPWIAQLGQGRGGLYSYDFLENLVGCDMHSADRIVAEWQDIKVGDEMRLHPEVPLEVVAVEPGHWLVVRGGVPMGTTPPPYEFTWAFVLRERADGSTRLLVRERYAYTRRWAPFLVEPVEAVSSVMSQKMMRGIRDRAERAAGIS
jgi:hypothetical protein